LIIYLSAKNVDGLVNYPYDNNYDGELKNLLITDNLSSLKDINGGIDPSLSGYDYDLPYGQIRIIPFKKRTIPIELQKALYAHGIVGRRR
jgi:hypothetical protein